MVSPSRRPRHLQPLTTHFHIHNKSFSSITTDSDAGTFHSAYAHPSSMEMRPISQPTAASNTIQRSISPPPATSPEVEAIKMDRQDSGFQDGITVSRQTSSSSRTRRPSPSKSKRRTTNSSTSSSTRPSTKRASRSAPLAVTQTRNSTSSGRRPTIHARHTLPQSSHSQFYHFPTLTDPQPEPEPEASSTPLPPPSTVHYWTSDSTRRLEYAAIDAASQGLKGFIIKLVPDCVLPASSRRTRFCEGTEDNDSDLGSVRRYRLTLPEDEKDGEEPRQCEGSKGGFRRRWSAIFGRRRSC
ncbi:uncharacterized protein BP5553_01695 [Venustampulla echinocandica]|uniref:Uncharacterized protein n=1 Tax=Venustampulla echinocandica TaxID=2656787 RepID=A0A370U1R0_9HELO|nr:uncharacterized protein BP5553_01695 [Venustampulla echinocandica]RDL41716.1 hypothetical protein BP5553_01695 [Venustampulla echinocandica]